MPHDQDIDKEMEPPKIYFGMPKEELEEARQKAKEKRRKLAKSWKPEGH